MPVLFGRKSLLACNTAKVFSGWIFENGRFSSQSTLPLEKQVEKIISASTYLGFGKEGKQLILALDRKKSPPISWKTEVLTWLMKVESNLRSTAFNDGKARKRRLWIGV